LGTSKNAKTGECSCAKNPHEGEGKEKEKKGKGGVGLFRAEISSPALCRGKGGEKKTHSNRIFQCMKSPGGKEGRPTGNRTGRFRTGENTFQQVRGGMGRDIEAQQRRRTGKERTVI